MGFLSICSTVEMHINPVIDTPMYVKKAEQYINQGEFLRAHHLLIEMEYSRNYILLELYKTAEYESREENIEILKEYFSDCDRLVLQLRSFISSSISRWYDMITKTPGQLVTALRIIEREEKYGVKYISFNYKNIVKSL